MPSGDDRLLRELLAARENREPCALVIVAAVSGSVPRGAGAKMIVYGDGRISGTIGGGKLEALVVQEALAAAPGSAPVLKTFPLREGCPDSFGAICGGEVTVLIEPLPHSPVMCIVGAGHCAKAIAALARSCGFYVIVIDDRGDLLDAFPDADRRVCDVAPPAFIRGNPWQKDDSLVLVSRNFEIDRDALDAALGIKEIGYVGMIGSRRKVLRVFDELARAGHARRSLGRVYAPIGLDIGAESPEEIAVSVLAEVLKVHRKASGDSLTRRSVPKRAARRGRPR